MPQRILVVLAVCLLHFFMRACPAAIEPVPIEGRLLVTAVDLDVTTYPYFLEGTSDSRVPAPAGGDISPQGDQIAYYSDDGWYPTQGDIWRVAVDDLDCSEAVNLTATAGLGGLNCVPWWSPDGSMIAFMHSDPAVGQLPCEAGRSVWIVRSDGSEAWQVTPDTMIDAEVSGWSPNQQCLLGGAWDPSGVGPSYCFTIDCDGSDLRVVPNIDGVDADWSPDGSKIAAIWREPDERDGFPGRVHQLRIVDPDGSNPEVLVENFCPDWVAEAIDPGGEGSFQSYWAGPVKLKWSPLGDRIAFLAVMPPDPAGPDWRQQVELWIYDLASDEVTRVTDNSEFEQWLSWNGSNTFSDDPEVTVDDVTVTFSDVMGEGVTTILRDDDPPEVETGFLFDYEFYELNTTAEVTGPITICMTYTDEQVPPEAEGDLAILHYDEGEQAWEDITTSRDPVNNVVCGETDSLSPVAFYGVRTTRFPDVPAWGYGDSGLDPYWAYYQIMACVEARIVAGYENGIYQPTGIVSRDQMAVYIARALAGGDDEVPEFAGTPMFPDVGSEFWALDYMEYAVASDVVAGYEDGLYHPDYLVARDQMAVFVARARGWVEIDDDMTTAPELFPDVPAGYWSGTAIEACMTNDVVRGYSDGYYRPSWSVSRDQMAVYVARAFELM